MPEDSVAAGKAGREELDGSVPRQEQIPTEAMTSEIVTRTPVSTSLRIASFLTIASGFISIGNGIIVADPGGWANVMGEEYVERYCGILVLVAGIGAILSGIASLVQRRISPAMAGAVMGMAGGGLAGFWFGVVAIVLLFVSDEDL